MHRNITLFPHQLIKDWTESWGLRHDANDGPPDSQKQKKLKMTVVDLDCAIGFHFFLILIKVWLLSMTNPVANNADQEDLTKWSSSSYSETMGKLGCWSVLDEYKQYILEELEPGQFREKIIPTYGVGIFFQHSMHNGKFVVSHLNPGSAAAMSKRILVGDVLFTLNSEKVAGWDWDKFRKKMFGPAGTFVELDFIRKTSADTAESNSSVWHRCWSKKQIFQPFYKVVTEKICRWRVHDG